MKNEEKIKETIIDHVGAAKIVLAWRADRYSVASLVLLYLKRRLMKKNPQFAKRLIKTFMFDCAEGRLEGIELVECMKVMSPVVDEYFDLALFLKKIPHDMIADYEEFIKSFGEDNVYKTICKEAGKELFKGDKNE